MAVTRDSTRSDAPNEVRVAQLLPDRKRDGGQTRQVSVLQGSDSCSYKERRIRMRPDVHGNIEVGAVHGSLPFTLPSASMNNAFVRGQLSLGSRRFPIGVVFDLGTDQPVRGQRNRIQFQFDAPKMLKAERWEQADQLHQAEQGLDSLKTAQSHYRRQLAGVEAKIRAYEEQELLEMPESAQTKTNLTDSIGLPATPVVPEDELPGLDGTRMTTLDSLRNTLPGMHERQTGLDSLVIKQEKLVQRAKALASLSSEKRGRLQELAQGIRRLELGSCAPSSSEFLLNGLNFQGVSFEYAHKELFLAFDHGRSFDDTWMNNDPVYQRLRQLHQSLFLREAQELSPKRISVLRTGIGTPEGSHAHIGFLRGIRGDIPLGYPVTGTPALELTNHVIEVDLGHVFFKRHTLQIIYARSVTMGGLGMDETVGAESTSVGDLFNDKTKNNEAMKAKWISDLIRTGTRLSAELRSIDHQFHSFGIGFIRNGSRALEVSIDQRINERMRLRGRATKEERTIPSSGTDGIFSIQRASVALQWNVSRALRLRSSYTPSSITPAGPMATTATTRNHVLTSGGSWRKRWKKTTLTADVDASAYWWTQAGLASEAVNLMIGTGVDHGERLTLRYTRNALARTDSASIPAVVNHTMMIGYRTRKGLTLDTSGQMANDGAFGWRLNVQHRLTERTTIRAEGNKMPRFDKYLSTIDGSNLNDVYTWTFAIQYLW